jgi:hypothetical protein
MLDIPNVGNALAVGPLEVLGRQTDDLHHNEGTFSRGGELVHSFDGLDATQDKVSHVEGLLSHIVVMVAA